MTDTDRSQLQTFRNYLLEHNRVDLVVKAEIAARKIEAETAFAKAEAASAR